MSQLRPSSLCVDNAWAHVRVYGRATAKLLLCCNYCVLVGTSLCATGMNNYISLVGVPRPPRDCGRRLNGRAAAKWYNRRHSSIILWCAPVVLVWRKRRQLCTPAIARACCITHDTRAAEASRHNRCTLSAKHRSPNAPLRTIDAQRKCGTKISWNSIKSELYCVCMCVCVHAALHSVSVYRRNCINAIESKLNWMDLIILTILAV